MLQTFPPNFTVCKILFFYKKTPTQHFNLSWVPNLSGGKQSLKIGLKEKNKFSVKHLISRTAHCGATGSTFTQK